MSSILIVLYLLSTVQATFACHFCMGKLVDISFSGPRDICAGCGMDIKKESKDCCKDVHFNFDHAHTPHRTYHHGRDVRKQKVEHSIDHQRLGCRDHFPGLHQRARGCEGQAILTIYNTAPCRSRADGRKSFVAGLWGQGVAHEINTSQQAEIQQMKAKLDALKK